MTKSDRIKVKLAIIAALAPKAWSEVELILDEFGVHDLNWDRWEGSIESFIGACLREARDEILHEIAKHLGLGVDPAGSSTDGLPAFWQVGHFRLFISHHHQDRLRAGKLREQLATYYISSFVAHDDIVPTAEWQREIESALRTMDAMVTLNSPHFETSSWTDQEVGFALGRGKLVVPVGLDGRTPYGFIGKHQAFVPRTGMSAVRVAEKIYTALTRNPLTKDRMLDALVSRFEQTTSYASARSYFEAIEQADVVPHELLDRIRKAHDVNNQIRDSSGVPERINELFTKHGYSGPKIATPESDEIPF